MTGYFLWALFWLSALIVVLTLVIGTVTYADMGDYLQAAIVGVVTLVLVCGLFAFGFTKARESHDRRHRNDCQITIRTAHGDTIVGCK